MYTGGVRKKTQWKQRLARKAAIALAAWLGLSACPPGKPLPEPAPVCRVIFDANGGETEAKPSERLVLAPYALGALPEEPTRRDHKFRAWNTARDGSGMHVVETTPITQSLRLYAQWQPALTVDISPGVLTFSPINSMSDTRHFQVEVSRPDEAAELGGIRLIGIEGGPAWLELKSEEGVLAGNAKTFQLRATYVGNNYMEDPVTLEVLLSPPSTGYEYTGRTQVRVVVGNGTPEHPIPVSQQEVPALFNTYANNNPQGRNMHYRLEEDVVLAAPSAGASNWKPIGTEADPFTGSFDGGGHTLSGLTLNAPGENCQGLFGALGHGSQVENLGLLDVNVTAHSQAGGLAGLNRGTVRDSYVTGVVRGDSSGGNTLGGLVGENSGTVAHSHATATVSAVEMNGGRSLGGLVGANGAAIYNSYATGAVTGAHVYIGGLAGRNEGTIDSSYATGEANGADYVGGLVGENFGIVSNSYATGKVGARSGGVGGLIGHTSGNVSNSYATGAVSGNHAVGGLVGSIGAGHVQNSVALNASVAATDTYVGRVAGSYDDTYGATLSNNYAREELPVRHHPEGELKLSVDDSSGTDGQGVSEGAGPNQYNSPAFWKSLGWDLDNLWQWGPDNLPVL